MMQRRGFLGVILAAGFAPAFVGSSVLMPVRKIVPAAPVMTITGARLYVGDRITITGLPGLFRVTSSSQGVVSVLGA